MKSMTKTNVSSSCATPTRDGMNESNVNRSWPRFLIVKATDENMPLSKLNPWAIEKAICGMANGTPKIKRLNSGLLLIEVDRRVQCENLLKTRQLAHIPVEISPHKSMNSSKCVIRCRDLDCMEEEEIKTELADQGVTFVKRIMVKRERQFVSTGRYILTCDTPLPPREIKVGFILCRTEIYIPNPTRCFQCQRFGHSKKFCRRSPVCANCGAEDHIEDDCQNEPCCYNCQGPHPVYARGCPAWQKERAILKIKYETNISFPEARRRVEGTAIDPNKMSFANATKPIQHCQCCKCQQLSKSTSNKQDIMTQTDDQSSASGSSDKKRSLSEDSDEDLNERAPAKRGGSGVSGGDATRHTPDEEEVDMDQTRDGAGKSGLHFSSKGNKTAGVSSFLREKPDNKDASSRSEKGKEGQSDPVGIGDDGRPPIAPKPQRSKPFIKR